MKVQGRGGELQRVLGPDLETGKKESVHQQTGKNSDALKERLSSKNAMCCTWED